eukprot:10217540-Ditylum_brightwellii.AAC.1
MTPSFCKGQGIVDHGIRVYINGLDMMQSRNSLQRNGSEVKDCVLIVPSLYTQNKHHTLLDAETLTNLNVLALINKNTATALHFGIDCIDETPQHFVFYNMGTSALQ